MERLSARSTWDAYEDRGLVPLWLALLGSYGIFVTRQVAAPLFMAWLRGRGRTVDGTAGDRRARNGDVDPRGPGRGDGVPPAGARLGLGGDPARDTHSRRVAGTPRGPEW